MIEIKIPKEIRKYEETFFMGMTFRQTICSTAAIGVNVPLYLYLSEHIGSDLAGWAVMVTTAPLALIGFITYNGMRFEKLAWCFLRFSFIPQKRKYRTDNFFTGLMEETEDENHNEAKRKKQYRKK